MPNARKKAENKTTWKRSDGDKSSYRGYQASYSSAQTLKLPKGGSVVGKVGSLKIKSEG